MTRYLSVMLLALPIISSPTRADEVQRVLCAEVAFSQTVEKQDPAAFKAALHPDARFIGTIVQRGPEQVFEAWASFFEAGGPRIKWRPQFVEVLASGDLALSRGPYRLTVRDGDGKEAERWGTFNSVWRRTTTGKWLVVFDAGSAPNEDPPEETRALLDVVGSECTGT